MGQLTESELIQKVVDRDELKDQRDVLTGGLSVDEVMQNPMALLTKMGDFKAAFEITQKIEAISDDIVKELIKLKTGG